MSSALEYPDVVLTHLQRARSELGAAHAAASEREEERGDLTGPVRDLLFGLNTAVDALLSMIEEGRVQ